ncbi:MAG: non-canonical purine NTP pyrophosphatase [Phycisphaerales bacterium]
MPPPDLSTVVLATRNPGKIAELRELFAGAGVSVVGIDDVAPDASEPEEGDGSFIENATIKARAYAAACGLPCLADDSGLEIDALDGAPGVISSHYAFDGRTDGPAAAMTRAQRDAANNERVLRELGGVPPERRTARFVCVMVLAAPALGGAGFQPASSSTYGGAFTTHTRRLPHWQCAGAIYFLTWRLLRGELTGKERRIVCDACQHFAGDRYELHALTVMPDHVHALLRPLQTEGGGWHTLPAIMHSIKRHSARQINRARSAQGPVWQREYFDRIIRSGDELDEKLAYIEMNAVRRGLCDQPGDYPFLRRATAGGGRLETGPTRTRILAQSRGTFEGRIGEAPDVPRGHNGFGYDPLFLVAPEHDRTGAELEPDEKNARSHRGAASRTMLSEIERLRS